MGNPSIHDIAENKEDLFLKIGIDTSCFVMEDNMRVKVKRIWSFIFHLYFIHSLINNNKYSHIEEVSSGWKEGVRTLNCSCVEELNNN